jgi:hypothetical protein
VWSENTAIQSEIGDRAGATYDRYEHVFQALRGRQVQAAYMLGYAAASQHVPSDS